jgi:hypothetical protein
MIFYIIEYLIVWFVTFMATRALVDYLTRPRNGRS